MNRAERSRLTGCVFSFIVIVLFSSSASGEWKEKVLYSFQGLPSDGAYPAGGVVFDKAGNLYGATGWGGGSVTECPGIAQCGIVYQLKTPTEKGKPWTETLLYVFKGVNYNDGNTPQGGVILDPAGNLYGTTAYGGSGPCQLFGGRVGCGTVFELMPPKQKGGKWTEKILHSFQSGKDGYFPWGNLAFDSAGNLYGATQYGGGYGSCNAPFYQHCGTVFKLSAPKMKGGKWTEQVLYAFKSGTDGANPNGGLALDSKGLLYGTTVYGGSTNCRTDGGLGCGTAFELRPGKRGASWTENQLHNFVDYQKDGAGPNGSLVFDAMGNLYGTTNGGGSTENGVVFRLARSGNRWEETVLRALQNLDGWGSMAGVIFGADGSLYGTARGGGSSGAGTVFRLSPSASRQSNWSYTVLYSFGAYPDGNTPRANLMLDDAGTLYSTTLYGGSGYECPPPGQYHCGTVFELSPRALK